MSEEDEQSEEEEEGSLAGALVSDAVDMMAVESLRASCYPTVSFRNQPKCTIRGHPIAAFNGTYWLAETPQGIKVLQNADAKVCYRYKGRGKWLLNHHATPENDSGISEIKANKKGIVPPMGSQTWKCKVKRKWIEHTVMVLPVRFPILS